MGDSLLNLHTYDLHFRFADDSSFFGDDACNSFHAKFKLINDSLSVYSGDWTELGCFPGDQFLPFLFYRNPRLVISDSFFVLSRNDTTFIFSSKFTQPVQNYPFLDKAWKLYLSNDTSFDYLNTHDLLPNIKVTNKREFNLWWNDSCSYRNDSSYWVGYYGIGPASSIEFTPLVLTYCTRTRLPIYDVRNTLFYRLLMSTSFYYSDTILTLENKSNNNIYRFVPSN